MDYETESIFASNAPYELGLGFHNIGSGALRYSSEALAQKLDRHYGQRCGHIPLAAKRIGVLVAAITDDTRSQVAYLSDLYKRKIEILTPEALADYNSAHRDSPACVVPYVNVPEAAAYISSLHGSTWGLPAAITHTLKNKALLHRFITNLSDPDIVCPDYVIADLPDLPHAVPSFLSNIRRWYRAAKLPTTYPLGVVLRAADEDGNYGSALMHETGGEITVVPDGNTSHMQTYSSWDQAIAFAHEVLTDAMDVSKESRVVVSRYIEMVDSPGISLVLLNGYVATLGWNGQLQQKGSKACVGTSSYRPATKELSQLQAKYEAQTAVMFERFLREVASAFETRFDDIRGVANIDIMLPGPVERQFMHYRGIKAPFYIAECNPRFTNYTDAILAILGVNQQVQSIANMKMAIRHGVYTMDKYILPPTVDPKRLRERIYEADKKLAAAGTRIICRMATSPMGVIFAGDRELAERTLSELVVSLS